MITGAANKFLTRALRVKKCHRCRHFLSPGDRRKSLGDKGGSWATVAQPFTVESEGKKVQMLQGYVLCGSCAESLRQVFNAWWEYSRDDR